MNKSIGNKLKIKTILMLAIILFSLVPLIISAIGSSILLKRNNGKAFMERGNSLNKIVENTIVNKISQYEQLICSITKNGDFENEGGNARIDRNARIIRKARIIRECPDNPDYPDYPGDPEFTRYFAGSLGERVYVEGSLFGLSGSLFGLFESLFGLSASYFELLGLLFLVLAEL